MGFSLGAVRSGSLRRAVGVRRRARRHSHVVYTTADSGPSKQIHARATTVCAIAVLAGTIDLIEGEYSQSDGSSSRSRLAPGPPA